MKKITPHLWFDKEVKKAAEFYVLRFEKAYKGGDYAWENM